MRRDGKGILCILASEAEKHDAEGNPGFLEKLRAVATLDAAAKEYCFPLELQAELLFGTRPLPTDGVGTETKKILLRLRIIPGADCNCVATAAEWDRNGIDWCEQHQHELIDYLVIQGKGRGWVLGKAAVFTARMIVRQAIKRAKKAAENKL
jgi:hypothetical protein